MRNIVLALVLFSGPLWAQTANVQKTISSNAITGDLVIPSGKSVTVASGGTLTIASGGTLTITGTLTGLVIGTNVQAWDADLDTWALKTAPSGTVVGTSDTQTLTGKTISGGSNTLSGIGNASLTNSAITIGGASTALGGTVTATTILDSIGSTRGSLLYRGASGWAAVSPGISGYVLTSNGSGADPSWQAVSGGATLAANTFTDTQTVTLGTANHSVIASTGYSITGSNASSMIDLAGTWNTSGAPVALKVNVTSTASDAAASLADFQLGGTSQCRITKDGRLVLAGTVYNDVNTPILCISPGRGLLSLAGGNMIAIAASTGVWCMDGNAGAAYTGSTMKLGFTSTAGAGNTLPDAFFMRTDTAAIQLGADQASPVAQTFGAGSGIGTDVAGPGLTFRPGNGTGTGGSGKLIFQTAPAASSGSAANTMATRMEVDKDGVLLLKECATVPSGSPTAGFFLYVDPADHKLKAKGASGTVTSLANP